MAYSKILVALDGSYCSDLSAQAALAIAQRMQSAELTACHVYASKLHFERFEAMEEGLPKQYQEENNLDYLRKTHDDLIGNGLELISDSYTKELCISALAKEIKCSNILPEGKNFKQILNSMTKQEAQLTILGGYGHGKCNFGQLGSVAERVLLYGAGSDILIMKSKWDFKNRPIIVGIDGSAQSYGALYKALDLAQKFHAKVIAAAVYDPFFHASVFKTIADVLPQKDQEKFNFTAQEKLHDEIIDKGLEKVYRDGLRKAEKIAQTMGIEIKTKILEGKVYPQIYHYANLKNASLVVLGRYGLHHEEPSMIGSNTLQVARLYEGNVLVAASDDKVIEIPKIEVKEEMIEWTQEAKEAMNNVPEFVRQRAKWSIEEYAKTKGYAQITEQVVQEVQQKIGMGSRADNQNAAMHSALKQEDKTVPNAKKVVFCKAKKLAPDFHRHILKSKIQGQTIQAGTKYLTYIVKATEPEGIVRVGQDTVIEFE